LFFIISKIQMVFTTLFVGFFGFVAGIMITSAVLTPQGLRMYELCELETMYGVDIAWVRETLLWNDYQKDNARKVAGGLKNKYANSNVTAENCFRVKIPYRNKTDHCETSKDIKPSVERDANESEPVAEEGPTATESEPVAEEGPTATESEPVAEEGLTESEPVAEEGLTESEPAAKEKSPTESEPAENSDEGRSK
jgi:hypothetical protein